MEEISSRQKQVLKNVIREYIRTARPVSSEVLKERYKMEVSPATIRWEFVKLSERGYLKKEYISGGRIPTEKAYRFYVDDLIREGKFNANNKKEDFWGGFESLLRNGGSELWLCQKIAKRLSKLTSNLVITRAKERILWKEGWENLLDLPEFQDVDYFKKFLQLIQEIEEDFDKVLPSDKSDMAIKVFIGRELPFRRKGEFSVISGASFCSRQFFVFLLAGPERMDFEKNISCLNSLLRTLSGVS